MRAKITIANDPTILLKLRKTDLGAFFISGITQEKCYCHWSVYLMFDQYIQDVMVDESYEVELAFVSNLAPGYFKTGDELIVSDAGELIVKGVVL